MSEVLIRMKMPKCCAECDVEGHYENSYGDKYGFFCPFGYKAYTEKTRDAKRLDNCPLVPVPPHWRLIDADALDDILADQSEDAYNRTHAPRSWERALSVMRDYLEDAPTIIPADQKEKQT